MAEADEKLRRSLVISLRRAGYEVEAVGSTRDAVTALSIGAFDVLLADAQLPGNTRLEVLGLIRAKQVCLPVALMTDRPTVDSVVEALRGGAVDYITKPIRPEVLFSRLDVAIQRRSALRAFADAQRHAAALSESMQALQVAVRLSGPFLPPTSSEQGTAAVEADPLERLSVEELGRLSPREREITRLLAKGCAAKEAATRLDLSPNTVRNHVKSIFAKLQVHSQVLLLGKLAGRAR